MGEGGSCRKSNLNKCESRCVGDASFRQVTLYACSNNYSRIHHKIGFLPFTVREAMSSSVSVHVAC